MNFLLIGLVPLLVLSLSSYAQAQQQMQQPPSSQTQQPQQQYPNQQPYAQQQNPFQQQNPGQLQQYPPQLQQQQQGQPLYNKPAVIACLNHQLIDSIVKAGTTGALTLHNNTQGATAGLNQTFITNATNTLDACIMPMRR